MNHADVYENTRARFETHLLKLTDAWDYPEPILSSMKYSLFTGGKRFRPVLLLETYKAIKGEIDDVALTFAAGVESLHTYTLIHDDLPCMDDDDYRRGQLTNHKKFGEDIAVLAGDALLNQAAEWVFAAIETGGNSLGAVRAGAQFFKRTGAAGLIGGQIHDVAFEKLSEPTFADIERIFHHKTCDLIIAAVQCGALLAGADAATVEALVEFAYHFGFVFQTVDDILDGEQADGCTILKIMSADEARSMADEYARRAVNALDKLQINTDFLRDFTLKSVKRLK